MGLTHHMHYQSTVSRHRMQKSRPATEREWCGIALTLNFRLLRKPKPHKCLSEQWGHLANNSSANLLGSGTLRFRSMSASKDCRLPLSQKVSPDHRVLAKLCSGSHLDWLSLACSVRGLPLIYNFIQTWAWFCREVPMSLEIQLLIIEAVLILCSSPSTPYGCRGTIAVPTQFTRYVCKFTALTWLTTAESVPLN